MEEQFKNFIVFFDKCKDLADFGSIFVSKSMIDSYCMLHSAFFPCLSLYYEYVIHLDCVLRLNICG